jgi:hypothetical protein
MIVALIIIVLEPLALALRRRIRIDCLVYLVFRRTMGGISWVERLYAVSLCVYARSSYIPSVTSIESVTGSLDDHPVQNVRFTVRSLIADR